MRASTPTDDTAGRGLEDPRREDRYYSTRVIWGNQTTTGLLGREGLKKPRKEK